MGLDDLISGFFGMSTVENISNQHRKTQDKCEYCSTTLDEIRETGRVGCAMCYKIFKDSLHPIIKKVHGSTQHVGHAPEGLTQDVTVNKEQFIEEKKNPVEDQINILKDEMKNAIKLEDYEQAAVLRDRIRLLEENVSGGEIT
jgi:protein arginine kinase activator